MKKRLLTLILAMMLGISLLTGGGTYALLTASVTNEGNQFGTFQAGTVNIGSPSDTTFAFQSRALTAYCPAQQVGFIMFYDHADYPTGINPYDVKTRYSPSGEIPGGWAPGDQVSRSWNIQNRGEASKITEIYVDNFSLEGQNGSIPSGSQAYNDFLNHMQVAVYYPPGSSTTVYTGTLQQLVSAPQPLDTIIYLSKKCNTPTTLNFVASMDLGAGNDLQGIKGVLDFLVGAEQVRHNCFDPPFSNRNYSMNIGSTTPIKFECYDADDSFITSCQNTSLVINGPRLGGGKLSLIYTGNGLSFNGGHYQANVYADPGLFVQGGTYTATVYNCSQLCGQKTFSTEPGNRSNAP